MQSSVPFLLGVQYFLWCNFMSSVLYRNIFFYFNIVRFVLNILEIEWTRPPARGWGIPPPTEWTRPAPSRQPRRPGLPKWLDFGLKCPRYWKFFTMNFVCFLAQIRMFDDRDKISANPRLVGAWPGPPTSEHRASETEASESGIEPGTSCTAGEHYAKSHSNSVVNCY